MKSFPRMRYFILVCSLSLGLSACKQTLEIKNGVIPVEFLPFVQKFLGSYHGQIELRSTGLIATLEDNNHLTLKSSDDIIALVCRSKIGNLTQLTYQEDRKKTIEVTDAFFDFDPNLCGNQILANQLHFIVTKQSPVTLDLIFLDHVEWGWRCQGMSNPLPYPRLYPPTYPNDSCWEEQYGIHQMGRLVHE